MYVTYFDVERIVKYFIKQTLKEMSIKRCWYPKTLENTQPTINLHVSTRSSNSKLIKIEWEVIHLKIKAEQKVQQLVIGPCTLFFNTTHTTTPVWNQQSK